MTLIETAVWIGIFAAVMVTLTASLLSFYKTNRYLLQESNAISNAQHGMDTVVRTIRTIAYSSSGAYPLISIAPNQFSFYSKISKGNSYIQQVRFFLQGSQLMQGVIQPAGNPITYASSTEIVTTLARYVQNINYATSTFFYYDKNGTQITNFSRFSDPRFVTINLIVDVSTTSSPTYLILTSSAALRNLVR